MTARKAVGVLDAMRNATPHTRRVTFCLNGELQAEYDDLVAEIGPASMQEDSLAQEAITRIGRQLDRVQRAMADSEATFTFVAIPWPEYLALQADHAPREGNIVDLSMGHNIETFWPALIQRSCTSVIGADKKVVTDIPEDAWHPMIASLNKKQFDVISAAADQANNHATTVPPSARSLLGRQASGASSKSQGPGTSRPSGSAAGSRHGSAATSTTKTGDSLP